MAHEDFKDFQSPNEASVDKLVEALDRAYHRPWLIMWRAFLQGVMTAIGAAVGTFIVLTVSVYVFRLLGGIDLLKPTVDKLQDWVITKQLGPVSPNVGGTSASLKDLVSDPEVQKLLAPTPTK